MRQERVIVQVTDDLTGEILPEGTGTTIVFGWEGRWLQIDLANPVAQTLTELLQPYVAAAREYREGEADPASPSSRSRAPRNYADEQRRRERNKKIREWALRSGFSAITNSGKIPAEVLEAWERAVAANGGVDPEPPIPERPSWEIAPRVTEPSE